ncbi:hypothetical protein EDB86DRAFT_3141892 [Lactarius hatsudake]|nr:hypothetical protein EDB86DRAFT_3141892 [Lactarius hatsudake]
MLSPSMILSAPSESVPPLRPFPFRYGLCCEANSCLSLRLIVRLPTPTILGAISVRRPRPMGQPNGPEELLQERPFPLLSPSIPQYRIVCGRPPSSPPSQHRTQEGRPTPLSPASRKRGTQGGTQCPPPPFSPVHATTFVWKGAQGHATAAAPFPCPWHPICVEGWCTRGARKGTRPPPFPICVEGGCTGALRPTTPRWPHPFPLVRALPRSRRQGACEGRPPHLSTLAPAPALPSCPRRPVRVEGGMQG